MDALLYIEKTREYLNYIEEHVRNVERAWGELQEKCKGMRFIYDDYVFGLINEEVKKHDLSKLSKEEFVPYRVKFYPVEGEHVTVEEAPDSWDHHKRHNPHHWQTWTNLTTNDPYTLEVHCVHMIIDWMAMGYKFGDNAQEYYEKHKDVILLPDWAEVFIYEIFNLLYGGKS